MIKLVVTGGTIDKRYNEINGQLCFPGTHVPEMLMQARCKVQIELELLMLKDSLDVTELDRKLLKNACASAAEEQIIITHGTDTMVESAQYLAASVDNKTIVLVGAMVPYKVNDSDALFNLGCAVTAVQLLPKGVYITMNGKVFSWNEVVKDRQLGEFKGDFA